MRARVACAVAGVTAALAGCAVGPNYKRPDLTVPQQFYKDSVDSAAAAARRDSIAAARSLADAPWWEIYQDTVLTALIDTALQNGFDARMALARVDESRAIYGVAKSQYYPQVGYSAAAAEQRIPTITGDSLAGVAAARYNVLGSLSWELDIWGRVRRSSEQANAAFLATEEGHRAALLSLTSDVATAYFELRELDAELVIARQTVAAFDTTYQLFTRRLEGGVASKIEPLRAEINLAGVEADVPELQRQIVAKENQINFLLGRPPQPVPRGSSLESQPMPPDVPAGLPSSLLERRPDIRAAEDQVISANAAVGVATANFFPQLSLTGLLGGISHDLSGLFTGGLLWSVGAGIAGPLFQGGRLLREKDAAVARWKESTIAYQATVTGAFGEVSTALESRLRLAEVEVAQARAERAATEASTLAMTRYLSGLALYFEVLQAETARYASQTLLARARLNRLLAMVQLYKSLGGGWQAEERAEAAVGAEVQPPAETPPH